MNSTSFVMTEMNLLRFQDPTAFSRTKDVQLHQKTSAGPQSFKDNVKCHTLLTSALGADEWPASLSNSI
jgi:hypothetical protein